MGMVGQRLPHFLKPCQSIISVLMIPFNFLPTANKQHLNRLFFMYRPYMYYIMHLMTAIIDNISGNTQFPVYQGALEYSRPEQ